MGSRTSWDVCSFRVEAPFSQAYVSVPEPGGDEVVVQVKVTELPVPAVADGPLTVGVVGLTERLDDSRLHSIAIDYIGLNLG